MDFACNEEQRLLKESVERFFDNEYPIAFRREVSASAPGFSREIWGKLAGLGLLGIAVPQGYAGVGASAVESSLVMEAIGRSLVVEPYLSTAIIGTRLLVLGGSEAQKAQWLEPLVEGNLLLTLAHVEPQARYDLANVTCRAERRGGDYVLNGDKSVVINGASADAIVVLARSSGQSTDAQGLSLLIVDRQTDGLTQRAYPTVDGLRATELHLENVVVDAGRLIGEEGRAFALLAQVIDEATVAVCAEAVGIMEAMFASTVEYLKERQQFGRPLSTFQVLQHNLVDMMIACELSRSLAYMAAVKVRDADAVERRKSVSAAKIQIGNAGRLVGQQCIQLHGGMGMADEMAIGLYFKRLTTIATMYGDVNYHRARFAAPD